MKLNNLSLAARLKIAFLIVPVLLIIVITIYSGINLIHNKNQLKKSTADQISESVIEKVDRNFYERFGDVQAYAVNRMAVETALTDSVSAQAQTFINTMISYYVLYDLMLIINKEGTVIASNTVDKNGYKIPADFLIGKNFAKKEWFKVCMSTMGPMGGAWYSDFIVNPQVAEIYESNGWGMEFAAPIKNDAGETIGIWYNFASWKEVTQGIREEALLSLNKTEPDAEIFLTDENHKVIDASDPRLVLTAHLKPADLETETTVIQGTGQAIHSNKYTYGVANSAGAYTFKGKKWHCITMIPKAHLSLANFFTLELILIDILFLGIALLVASIISKNLTGKIYQLKNIINRLSAGDLAGIQPLHWQGKNELVEMSDSIGILTNGLKQTSTFAEEVGKGNFEAKFTPLSQADTLGNALIQMSKNLKIAAEEDKKRNWIAEGLARFTEIVRIHTDLKDLADHSIANLVKYLDASHGSLFIVNDAQKDEIRLEMAACYAFDRKKYIEKTIDAGEGLLGQAFLEKETVYRTELPPNYIKITSGLGEATPACILIVPLKMNEKVEGVIEIASFNKLESHQIAFVEKLAENIASAISILKVNQVTRQLLEESQRQTEMMKLQEEEMRKNAEYLLPVHESNSLQ